MDHEYKTMCQCKRESKCCGSCFHTTNMNENMTYPIIKSGVINFARQMCSYYGKYNIRVNTVFIPATLHFTI